jgi:uncharacterized membrane protein
MKSSLTSLLSAALMTFLTIIFGWLEIITYKAKDEMAFTMAIVTIVALTISILCWTEFKIQFNKYKLNQTKS